IAAVCGLVLLGIGRSAKRAVAVIVAIVVLIAVGVALQVPALMRVVEIPQLARTGGLEVASSGRVAPVLAAMEMLRDHPLTGVGPGAFKSHYMTYKLRVMEKNAHLLRGTSGMMFGEAHNDHVQLAAEFGAPGYLLFLALIVALLQTVRRSDGAGVRHDFTRALALPLAVTFVVLAIAQFPLHVAVTRHLLVTFAGLLAGWSAK
ncbi:MAG TPA: O-antigen ligase family protein, partial [Thermoanaerobaculia bacterium]|nr:O-antigen ligase family protein [Thermoanaerobaculia bacterium]